MASRKPLVLTSGRLEQLQPLDTIDGLRPLDYISGWNTTNNSGDPTNDIDVGAGVCWINDRLVELTTPITKRLDTEWAAGTNQGGLLSGSKAVSTWYHILAMYNPGTGAVDAAFSTSVTGTDAPSGWVVRRVWSVQTKSDGVIRAYTQFGDKCVWTSPPVYSNSSIGNTTRVLATLTVPTGVKVEPDIDLYYTGASSSSNYVWLSSPDQADETADFSAGRLTVQSNSIAPVNSPNLLTNTSGQVGLREALASSGDTARILVRGYRDLRGRQ